MFGWLALKNRILTMDNLRRKGIIVVNACLLCLQDEESVVHLLLKCKFTHRICNAVLDWFGLGAVGFSQIHFRSYMRRGLIILWRLEAEKCRTCHLLLSYGMPRRRGMLAALKGLPQVQTQCLIRKSILWPFRCLQIPFFMGSQ